MVDNMADEVNPATGTDRLEALADAAASGTASDSPPLHLWNPPSCGDIGLRITRDGVWRYRDSPIARPALVRLFARVLRRDPDGYVLVTPVEKVPIAVEDAPFLAVEMRIEGDALIFRTNLGDEVAAGADHPLRFEPGEADGVKPYVHIRADLWALVTRALAYDLLARAETRASDGVEQIGVSSKGHFFVIAQD